MAYNSGKEIVPVDRLTPINDRALEIIKGIEGQNFNALVAAQFYMMTVSKEGQVNLFIKKAGLLHKMEQKYGNKAVIQSEPVMGDELKALREMDGIKDGQRYFVFKAKVFVPGVEQPFITYGSANEYNCRNGRLLEMAETRATNRAIRLATNCGFTSEEEYSEKMTVEEIKEWAVKEPPTPGPDAVAMKNAFFAKFREAGFDPKDSKAVMDYVLQITGKNPKKDKPTVEDYGAMIADLDRRIEMAAAVVEDDEHLNIEAIVDAEVLEVAA